MSPPSDAQGPDSERLAFRPGHVVAGRYRLDRLLSQGSATVLYAARDLAEDQDVAVKLLHPQLISEEEVVLRFLQEARCATALRHPNIALVMASGSEPHPGGRSEPLPYLVEELLDGQNLRALLAQQQRFEAGAAVELLGPMASALELLHRAGIVHRDIKPENLVLSSAGPDRRLKLIDFGLSKVKSGPRVVKTRARSLLGSPLYASPEQLRGDPDIDGRADQWALGVVLFEMLAGQCPFRASTLYELIAQVLDSPAPRLDSLAPEAPPALVEMVATMLQREKSARYPSMYAVQEALIDCPGLDLGNDGAAGFRQRHTEALVTTAPPAAQPCGRGEEETGPRRKGWFSRLFQRRS